MMDVHWDCLHEEMNDVLTFVAESVWSLLSPKQDEEDAEAEGGKPRNSVSSLSTQFQKLYTPSCAGTKGSNSREEGTPC